MAQRVDYEALPGTRYDQYITKLHLILGFLQGPDGTKFKPFRDFLRKNGLWDKEKAVPMLALVDISWDRKTVAMGDFAKKIADAKNDEEIRDKLYDRLASENVLLVKYVLEALDVEGGGRLHSVHELYRMITSYVYPGEYITLTNFQAWMDWMASTGYIKLVGIRWALSAKGQKAVSELKLMDVEEILEDLEEEESSREDVAAAAAPAAEAPAGGANHDERADLPPEPQPPSDADIAAAEAAFLAQFGDVEAAEEEPAPATGAAAERPAAARQVAAPAMAALQRGLHLPLPMRPTVALPEVLSSDPEAKALAEQLISWWNVLGDWPVHTAADLGVELGEENGDALLLELAVLAVLIEGHEPQPQIFALVGRMRDTAFFSVLAANKPFDETIAALGDLDSEPWLRGLVERLVHAPTLAKRMQAAPGLCKRVQKAKSGREALLLLREQLFGPWWALAPFWTLRELVRVGICDRPQLASAAVVPSRRLLRNAARIGIIDRPNLASFDELIAAAEATAALFGSARAGYGEALEVMDRALKLGA